MDHWSSGLFKSPIELIVEGWEDPFASYSFDMTDIVRVDGEWYLVNTAGCSCPGYAEMASVMHGPATLADLRVWFEAEYGNRMTNAYYREDGYYDDMIKAFDKAAAL